ncbi:hypothetical protein ASZ90_012066 [hydrocarbon metagenome]|uniref:Uncharacterized protein n=1 Tax=hydrocarbon metagenome TaxID=938273 RepID=A0A0W8FBR7_9ZZZZ
MEVSSKRIELVQGCCKGGLERGDIICCCLIWSDDRTKHVGGVAEKGETEKGD